MEGRRLGLLVGLMQAIHPMQWVALKTHGGGCLSRCPNSYVFAVVSAQPIHPAKCLSIMRLLHIVTCVVCKGEKDVCDEKQKMCVMKSAWNRSRERLRLDPRGCPPYFYTDSGHMKRNSFGEPLGWTFSLYWIFNTFYIPQLNLSRQ